MGEIKKVDGKTFYAALERALKAMPLSRAVCVATYTPDYFKRCDCYLTPFSYSGFAVNPQGEIVSLFSLNREGRDMVECAIAKGGRTLNCFDGFLAQWYRSLGFVEYNRVPFDWTQAPDEWGIEFGTPDVVFFRLGGITSDHKYDAYRWEKFDGTEMLSIDVRLDIETFLKEKGDELDGDSLLWVMWMDFDADEYELPSGYYMSDFEKFLHHLEHEHGIRVGGIYGDGEPVGICTLNEETCLADDICGWYFELDGEIGDNSVSGSYLYSDGCHFRESLWECNGMSELGLLDYNRATLYCPCGQTCGDNWGGDGAWNFTTDGEPDGTCGERPELSDFRVIEEESEIEEIRDELRAREAEQRFFAAQCVLPGLEPPALSERDERIIWCEETRQLYCPHCLQAMEAGVW